MQWKLNKTISHSSNERKSGTVLQSAIQCRHNFHTQTHQHIWTSSSAFINALFYTIEWVLHFCCWGSLHLRICGEKNGLPECSTTKEKYNDNFWVSSEVNAIKHIDYTFGDVFCKHLHLSVCASHCDAITVHHQRVQYLFAEIEFSPLTFALWRFEIDCL